MSTTSVTGILGKINAAILNPLIILLFAIAVLLFLWGIFLFILHNDDDSEREKGKKNIVWGLIGIFIMLSVLGIINLILDSFGIPKSYPFS